MSHSSSDDEDRDPMDIHEDQDNEDSDEDDEMDDLEKIRVKFVTKQKKYRVADTTIAVPTEITRSGLSKIINHLLELDPVVPFDFLIVEKDVLIRTKLGTHIGELNLSKEQVLELEYAPAIGEPEEQSEQEFPDWVACIDARRTEDGVPVILSGAYDGSIQISTIDAQDQGPEESAGTLQLLKRFNGHRSAVKSVCHIEGGYIISGSKDGLVKLYETEFSAAKGRSTRSKKAANANAGFSETQMALCEAHRGSVESVDGMFFDDYLFCASAGWDRTVQLWKIPKDQSAEDAEEDEKPSKSRKLNGNGNKQEQYKTYKESSAVFSDHLDNVSSVCWGGKTNPTSLFSGSWDRSIKTWDVTRECCVATLNGSKVITSISYNEKNQTIASGHADHYIRIWDARTVGDAIVKLVFKSHSAWVPSVKFNPVKEHLLLSCSHDQTVKVWDTRSSIPLHTISAHSDKLLAIDWDHTGELIFSGGADSILKYHKIK